MTGFVALLRGVNVGGNRKIAMADLRVALESLGFGGVRTHLQSGNAVFTAPGATPGTIAARIEGVLSADLGLPTTVLVRTAKEMRAVVAGNPLLELMDNGSRMAVAFLATQPTVGEPDLVALDPDRIRVGDRVIYQWCPNGLSNSPDVRLFVERKLKVAATVRNWNSVTKLSELAEAL